ncbi:3-keto-disaccharide hydrolase [Luteibacter sp. E-22]|uniref:3-keto-disaccharide hydrolase n=1 Tax=Luteibacter sp. E-22 TaxID=3404050 RepID=UPI003CE7FBB0
MKRQSATVPLLFVLAAALPSSTPAQADPKATEQWEPVPEVVTPGRVDGAPPSDAIVLFDGRDLSQWESSRDHSVARWKVHDGVVTVDKASGNIQTRRRFKDYQLHLEWQVPKDISGDGQERGNSGLFLASTGPGDEGYEIQIMDSWKNATYVNGQAASIYKQAAPMVNAMRPPGEWQTYDVIWTAPVFSADGVLTSPAYVTLFHNGVLVQNHTRLSGETVHVGKPKYTAHAETAIKLQAHGDRSPPLSFRNIWVRALD